MSLKNPKKQSRRVLSGIQQAKRVSAYDAMCLKTLYKNPAQSAVN